VPFEWPENPSAPDGDRERLFVLLSDLDPGLTDRLRRRYAERWVVAAHLAPALQDAMDTVELKIAPDEEPGRQILRLRSFYTGSTYWQHAWDGSEEDAMRFMEETAEMQAANVGGDRRHGPVLWDPIGRQS
jgi:hypothetical protein